MKYFWQIILFLVLAGHVLATTPVRWHRLTPGQFAQRSEVNERIDFTAYDHRLMVAAIFHETNRIRREQQLKVFGHLPKLDAAAEIQAGLGALLPGMSHRLPLPSLAGVADRVGAVGLKPRIVAENLALTMTMESEVRAADIQARGAGSERRYFDPGTNRELRQLTYARFAAVVVQQWMDSPGHRANLLNPELAYLGCSARWRKDFSGVDLLYSVQVFFTPITAR